MIFSSLYAILTTLLISLSALGYGVRLLSFGNTEERLLKSMLLETFLAFGLGAGILSLMTLLIGLVGGLEILSTIFLLGTGLLSGGMPLYRQISKSVVESCAQFRRLGRFKAYLVMIAVFALLNSLAALAPPVDIDVLNYHLAVPHIYAQHQRILPLPGIYHSYFPFNIQMLYTLCLVLKSSLAAQCLHVMFGLANLVLIGGIASHFYGPKTAVMAATLFYSIADVGGETPLARIDLGVSFYALLSLLCLLKASGTTTKQRRLLIYSGILGGLCAGAKYTALIVPLLLLAHILVFLQEPLRRKIKFALLFALIVGLVASPWYLRNYLWTENPVFPFLTSIFGRGPLTEEAISRIRQGNWNYASIPRTLKNFLLAPWLLLVQREAFSSNRIGPLFLSYLPLFFLLRRHHLRRLFPLLLFCLLWSPFWFWTSPLLRFLFAPLGLLCILLAQSLRLALRYNLLWRVLTLNFLALWLTFTLGWNMKYHIPLASVALGLESSENFLERQGELEGYQYKDFKYINTRLKPERLLLFGSNGLYIERPFVLAEDWASEYWDDSQQCHERALRSALGADGLTHVMIPREPVRSSDSREAKMLRCLNGMTELFDLRPVYRRGTTQIFSLTDHI